MVNYICILVLSTLKMATWLASNMLVTTTHENDIHKTKEPWLVF